MRSQTLITIILAFLLQWLPAVAETFDEAILKRELKLAEQLSKSPLERADVWFEMGFRDRAWLEFRKLESTAIPPDSRARFFLLRGKLEADLGHPELAQKNFKQVEKESCPPSLSKRLYQSWVEFALSQNDLGSARKFRDKLNELPDSGEQATLATARILAAEGRNQAALSILRSLISAAVDRGRKVQAYQYILELALLLDRMNRGNEAWRANAEVLRRCLDDEREWLAAQSFDTTSKIKVPDLSASVDELVSEILSKMPRTRLGLHARYWSMWGPDAEHRRAASEAGMELAVELEESQIAALFAVRRADFAKDESAREAWSKKAYELASSRPAYKGSGWYTWVQPERLERSKRVRRHRSLTQRFADLAEREPDIRRRMSLRDQARRHAVLENDAVRCFDVLPIFLAELSRAPRELRQLISRDPFSMSTAGLHWSATPEELQLGGFWETPIVSLSKQWLKAKPKTLQTLLDALLEDLKKAKLEGDKLDIARAQECLSGILSFVGRGPEGLAMARESMASYESVGKKIKAASVLFRYLSLIGQNVPESLVDELVSRYQGHEDDSLIGCFWISQYYRKTSRPVLAESFMRKYLSAPSGRKDDPRRAYVFLELASLQRDLGEFEESLQSLGEVSGPRGQSLRLARARTLLAMGEPEKALLVLEFEPSDLPASQIQQMRLQSQSLFALGRREESEAVDQQLKLTLEQFLKNRYHPELHEEIFAQPMMVATLKEFSQRGTSTRLDLPKPPPLPEIIEEPLFGAEALEHFQRRSPLARKNLKLNWAEIEEMKSNLKDEDGVVHLFPMEESIGCVLIGSKDAVVKEYIVGSRWREELKVLKRLIATPGSNLERVESLSSRLGERLLEPWLNQVSQNRLFFLAGGELSGFPLETLSFGGKPLLSQKRVAYLDMGRPTSNWLGLPKSGSLIDGSQGLAGAKEELKLLGALLPQMKLRSFSGESQIFRADDPLIHICSHGSPPDSQALLGKLLAGDEALEGADISELSLRANQLVVLSSCSGGVDPFSRDNTLAHLFRAAGAGRVVASLWQLDDQVAPLLFTEFYRQLGANHNPIAALTHARRVVAKQSPHPFYWGGVVLYQNLSPE